MDEDSITITFFYIPDGLGIESFDQSNKFDELDQPFQMSDTGTTKQASK